MPRDRRSRQAAISLSCPDERGFDESSPGRRSASGSRALARVPPRRARHALSADLPRLPRGDIRGRRAVRRVLAGDAIHRTPFLRPARHAVRARPRRGTALRAGGHRPAGLSARPRGRAIRGRSRAAAGASAEIFRPRRTRAPMGAWMARAGADVLAEADAIVPVPLHARRLWMRRFNQAAALAREVARRPASRSSRSCCGASRRRAVRSASPASSARRTCRAPSGRRRRAAVKGRRIVLVDDVLTSGATANAAARALLRAGAAQVDLIVFARVVTST